jgi:hypothetical protein
MSMDDGQDRGAPWRRPDGRFGPGNPGRPFGVRSHATRRAARAILKDFEAHQAELLPRLGEWFVPQYVQLVARLLPRQTDAGELALDGVDERELAAVIAEARAALDRIESGGGSLADLEAALAGDATFRAPQ